MITQERLKKLFDYREDGQLIRKITVSNQLKGTCLGHVGDKGYIECVVDYDRYQLHQLIFLYHYGYIPSKIDHKDTNPGNNRVLNLRACTVQENGANRKIGINNTSGIKGLIYNKQRKYWEARVNKHGARYSKSFKGSIDDLEIKNLAISWLETTRLELHQEFCRHA
jgi:hypothetical protein